MAMGLRKSPLKRKKSLKDYCLLKHQRNSTRPPKMKAAGKKTSEWIETRAKLKVKFAQLGITTCELDYPGCWKDNALGFAHTKKRRKLKKHELTQVALLCNICHDKIEALPEVEMTTIIRGIIVRRNTMHLRTEHAPASTGKCQNVVNQVRLGCGEDVVWEFTHTAEGSFVSGFEIIERPAPIDEPKP